MQLIEKIAHNTSLWEVVALIMVIYLILRPDIINRITKFKFGDFEMELSEIKKELIKGKERISELEDEIENEKRQFEELIHRFDANAPQNELISVRQILKSQARNNADIELYRNLLKIDSTPEELYATVVSIREKRSAELLPDIVSLLNDLTNSDNLGGFRLNIIWIITSSIHKILISCVRDGLEPFPNEKTLDKAEKTLKKLEIHPLVLGDRPDNPLKGIRGPIRHSITWIKKAREINKNT
jgi:hypothetical protein